MENLDYIAGAYIAAAVILGGLVFRIVKDYRNARAESQSDET